MIRAALVAVSLAVLFVASLIQMSRVGEFIYFRF